MGGPVGPEPPSRLLELPLAAGPVAPAGLVPGDRDVQEPLEEVALLRRSRTPDVLQHLVGGEVLAAPDQGQAPIQLELRPRP